MKAILVNYNYDPSWLTYSPFDYHVYDRSDERKYTEALPQERVTYTKNLGQVDYDKLTYLIDNYENLPDVFLWGKTNILKYITEEELAMVCRNKTFTPLLTQHHETFSDKDGAVCYYQGRMYYERNSMRFGLPFLYAETYTDFARLMGFPNPTYIPFAPGGNYILTRETVHKHPKELYEKMRNMLPHAKEPAEAQFCERSYYTLWK